MKRSWRPLSARVLAALIIGALLLNLAPGLVRPQPVAAASVPPLLVLVDGATNPYSAYLEEILNAEGLNDFEVRTLSSLSSGLLGGRRVVILAESSPTGAQITLLDSFVSAGGGLIAMRPAAGLDATFGVARQSATTAEGYMRITDPTLGAGLYGDTMQFHGTSSQYTLAGATQVAALYSSRTTAVGLPAVTLANRGSGKAAMFSYDLARSVVLTRQGNPNSGNVDVDGDGVLRNIDLYKNWADLERTSVPQADIQQRLLVRLIETVGAQPVPRLWYFPNGAPTVVVATGDAHANPDSYYQDEIDALRQIGATMTFYMSPAGNPSAADVAAWRALGFDFAPHPYVDCGYDCGYDSAFAWFEDTFGFAPRTARTHQVRWSGWTAAATVESQHGVALDMNSYQWGPWLTTASGQPALGYLGGSGQPMRYVDTSGTLLPIYQQHTVLVDEELAPLAGDRGLSLGQALAASQQIIDDSINGYYTPITTQFHVDYFYPSNSDWALQSTQYAMQRGALSLTADSWLNFIEDRAATAVSNTTWSGTTLSFTVGSSSSGQRMLVPFQSGSRVLSGITVGGSAASYTTMNVNGTTYASVVVQNGNYVASYATDTTAPTVSGVSPAASATNVSTGTQIKATFSERMNRTAAQSAFSITPATAGSFSWDTNGLTMTFTPSTPLAASTTYNAAVSTAATDLAGNPLAGAAGWSFATGAVTPPPSIIGVSPISGPIAGGTVATISGNGFAGATAVQFGGVDAAAFTVTSDTAIAATAPAHAAGTVDITVTTPIGTSAIVTADRFSYIDQSGALAINTVDPGTGSAAGGVTVTIGGANFATGATVRFGGTLATNVNVTSTMALTAVVPAHAAGAVSVVVTNPNNQSATLANGYTYVTCPTGCLTQTTAAQFAAGAAGAGGYVAQSGDGEVQLAPAAGAEFGGTALPAGWSASPWGAGGGAAVGGGTLAVDGALVATDAYFSPGRALEFVATFDASTPFQHGGFGTDLNSAPWAIFSTGFIGGTLYARTNNGAGQTDTALSGNFLGAPHRFRIEWTATGTNYFVDGSQVATHQLPITIGIRPVFSDSAAGGGKLAVDWSRVTPFASSGTFTSRVLDAAGNATWGTAAWSATTPPGTGAAVSVRRGNTPTPDASWTSFAPIANGASVGGSARYLQYQVTLTTAAADQAPALRDITIGYSVSGVLAPTVTDITPATGPTAGGTVVTITGSNFAAGASVTFDGAAATNVSVTSATTLTATVPAHAAGSVDAVVTNQNGATGTMTNGFAYVAAPPVVSGVAPSAGPSVGGTTVSLGGSGFTGATLVSFGGAVATGFTVNSDTSITATAPARAVGTVNVTVTTPAGTSPTAAANQYTYQASAPTPQVGRVTPGTGAAAGGAAVTISGINFVGVNSVTFGGTPASFTVASATTITATAPAHAAGLVDVRVATTSGTSAAGPAATYSYVSCTSGCLTQTTAAQFAAGAAGAGGYVAQSGDGEVQLAPAAGAEFGGTALPAGWSASPWGAGGGAAVGGGTLAVDGALVATDAYFSPGRALEFVATFDANAPSQHVGLGLDLNGTPWAIFSTGSGGALYARSNGAAQFDTLLAGDWLGAPHRFRIEWANGAITYLIDGAQVASHAIGGTGDMRPVISDGPAGGATLRLDWLRLGAYAATGTYTSTVIDAGGAATWGTVAWSGDLPAGTSVALKVRTGNSPTPDATWGAFAPVANGGSIGATGRYLQYQATLATTDPAQTPTLADLMFGYAITGLPAPTLTALLPASGPAAGGTTVTLTGTGLTGATAVSFGGSPATFTVNSDTSITAVAPAHATGVVDVIVTAPGGLTATSAGSKYTYQSSAAAITSLSPVAGPTAGGTAVAITGSGFAGATAVSFGGTAATSFTVNSDASISAVAPPHAAGVVNVTVTTPVGTSATGTSNEFTFVPPGPAVAQVSPGIGPVTGGTTVAISGSRFTGATAVSFGGTPAIFTVNSDTSITATSPSHVAGAVDVVVTTPLNTSLANPAARFNYVACPDGCATQTTAAAFAAGSRANAAIQQDGDGEVSLAPVLGLEFDGTTLPSALTATPWGSGGGAAVSGGSLVVDGALVATPGYFSPGRALEFVATFDANAPSQHVGLGLDLNGAPWAIFSTGSGGALYARSNGAAQFDTLLAGDWLGAPHRFRIEWANGAITYLIDGAQVASHAIGGTGDMRPVISDGPAGGATLRLDWLRLGAYAATGTYTSTVIDAGGAATWGTVAWSGTVPTGTGLAVSVRTSADSATWGAFTPVTNGGAAGATGRYLQYQVALSTTNPDLTPTFADVIVSYAIGAVSPPPTVTATAPASGPAAGGTTVTIAGTDFTDALAVTFGNAQATSFNVTSPTAITAVAPPGTGTVDVTVSTRFGTSTPSAAGRFAYVAAPTVASISPVSGPAAGGTTVTITGTAFATGLTVSFGETPATVVAASATSLTVTAPPHAPGAVTITVTNQDGQSGSRANGFAYVAAPTLTAISPNAGPIAGGMAVAIAGTEFVAGSVVTFDGIAATSVVVSGTTGITATTPPHAAGVVTVTVTNPDGQNSSLASAYAYHGVPTVASIGPNSGTTVGGTAITITGANFVAGSTAVAFGGVPGAGVAVQSATTLTVETPGHAAGAVDVVVTTPGGPSAAGQFTFVPPPTIADISPNSGPLAGGTVVTITGTSLGSATSVTFGGVAATSFNATSGTTITATAPAGSAAAAVDIVVTTPYGAFTSPAAERFTYVAPPAVSAVSPEQGPSVGGTAITIAGTGFLAGATVRVGGTVATGVTIASASSITATTPTGSVGAATVTVTNPDGQVGTRPNAFTYVGAPTVSAIAPNQGPTTAGTVVTITGTNFLPGASVSFGGTAATNISVASLTSLTATAPARSAGAVTVTVTNPGGQAGSLANGYTFRSRPTISFLLPDNGTTAGNATVTIFGSNFVSGSTTVTFDGIAGTSVSVSSSSQLTVRTPAHAAGDVDVVVATAGGASTAATYTYVPPAPTVSTVDPNAGPLAGGTVVTITGTNFTGATRVRFGTTNATSFTVTSATTITATTPSRATTGTVDVEVTTPGGSDTAPTSERFTYVGSPTLSGISPSSGPLAGGTVVTITGNNLLAGATVTFAGTPATNVTVASLTSLTATAPARSAGLVTVTVTNPGGQSASLTNSFTYRAQPTISAISPNGGPVAGGTTITITGANFVTGQGNTTVTFDGVSGTGLSVASATSLTVTTPADSAGTVAVVVATGGGPSSPGQFTYYGTPSVSAVSPSSGSTAGGTVVTISGTNIAGATAVIFGTTSVSTFTYVNNGTQIRVVAPARAIGQVAVRVTTPGGTSTATISNSNRYTYTAGGNAGTVAASERTEMARAVGRRRRDDDESA